MAGGGGGVAAAVASATSDGCDVVLDPACGVTDAAAARDPAVQFAVAAAALAAAKAEEGMGRQRSGGSEALSDISCAVTGEGGSPPRPGARNAAPRGSPGAQSSTNAPMTASSTSASAAAAGAADDGDDADDGVLRRTAYKTEDAEDVDDVADEENGDENGDIVSCAARHGCADITFSKMAGRVGLENLGNTCFMNAGLQCLSHLEPFAAFFLSGRYKEEVNRESPLGCKGELVDAFADLQRSLWQGDKASHAPRGFHERLERFRPDLLEGHEQQDVQEFLAFCLDGLHEDLNRLTERPKALTPEEEKEDERLGAQEGEMFMAALSWMRYLERGRSFIVDLMQGQLRSSLTCVVCGHRSRRFEPFLYLSLPVSWDMCSISDALQGYLAEELLTEDEQWYCETCKKKVDARKKIDLWELPPVLVVHLKRFEFDAGSGRFRKIGRQLATPLCLDLTEFCSTKQACGATYDVTCVANHRGKFETGHYTATCYASCRFFEFDDTEVRRLKRDTEVVGPHAYVLFLVRRSQTDGCFSGGHRAPLLRKQSISLPELWPQRRSNKENNQLAALRRPGSSDQAASAADCAAGAGGAGNGVNGSSAPDDGQYVMRFSSMVRYTSFSDDATPSVNFPPGSLPQTGAGGSALCCEGLRASLGLLRRR